MLRSSTKDNNKPASAPDLSITSQTTPPITIENSTVNIQPPIQRDFHTALMAIFTRQHAVKTEEDIARMTDYLFGDTRQALMNIKNTALTDCKAVVAAFIDSQPANEQLDPRLAAYRTATCASLADNLQSQEQGIDRTIASEMKALASDDAHTAVVHAMKDYLIYKQHILKIYLGLASALYKCAVEYYKERWLISHDDPIKLKKECEAFNYIFKDIIQINPDYTLTSIKAISEALFRKTPAGMEDLVNEMLKRAAYNKLDEKKASYAILLNHLNAYTNNETNISGDYFQPLNIEAKKHAIAFHKTIHATFDHYLQSRYTYEKIPATAIENAVTLHIQLRSRIIEFTKCAAETTEKELAAAKENIARYQTFLTDAFHIEENEKSLQTKLGTTQKLLKELKLPLQKIREIGLTRPITQALIDAFEKGELGKKRSSIFRTFADLQNRISEQHTKLHHLKLEYEDAKLTLHVVDSSEHTQAIKYQHKEIKHDIAQLDNDIADTKRELLAASKFLDQVQTAKATIDGAMQYYQDLIDGKIHDDYFAEESGGHQPFTAALKKISSLKERKHYDSLPDELKKYFDESTALLTQTQKDLTAILRCHLLFNSILNFNFWRLKTDRNVTILADNQRCRIPRAIFLMIKLAKRAEYQNWTNDPEAASHLLQSMQELAAKTPCKSPAVKQFMAMITQPDDSLLPPSSSRNPLTQMFMRPLRLIQQHEIQNIQKEPPFWKRHPILKKILIGTGIALLAFTAVAAITGLILYGVGTLTGIVHSVGGASATWGIAGGSLAAAGGIGAGIGAIVGKVQEDREQPQPHAANAAPAANIHRRPPPPAYKPAPPDAPRPALQEVRVSSAREAMFHQQEANFSQKNAFEQLIVDNLLDLYCGKMNEAHNSPQLRQQFTKMWDACQHSLDHFIQNIERSRPATAASIIKQAVTKAAEKYPHAISKYPAAAAVRNRYLPQKYEAQDLRDSQRRLVK